MQGPEVLGQLGDRPAPLLRDDGSLVQGLFQADPIVLAGWATEVECISAIARLERDGEISSASVGQALARFDVLMVVA